MIRFIDVDDPIGLSLKADIDDPVGGYKGDIDGPYRSITYADVDDPRNKIQ